MRRHYSDEQIVELVLDIMKWSHLKALVALRLEAPVRDGLSEITYDSNGDATIRAALPG